MNNNTHNAALIEERAAEWLARRDGPGWDQAQQQQLDAWLAEAVTHRVAYLRLNSTWQRADRLSALRPAAALQPPPPPVSARAPARRWLARPPMLWMAASLALMLVLGGGWFGAQPSGPPGETHSTAVGSHESLTLADGSRLMLNTDTRLRTAVGPATRTVWLDKGEAYFDIAHDAGRPFVVLAGDRRITVLGTRFSVRRQADRVDVVVEQGRVKVEPLQETASPDLSPTIVTRNQAVVSRADNMLVVAKAPEQIGKELSWRQGKLVFDQMTLADAAAEFNRYNRKKLVIDDPALAGVRIGGSFDTGNVQGFAALMQNVLGVALRDTGEEIRMSADAPATSARR
jgi:transmembrane sensor